jgi:tRNA(His) guanylyltransferase
MKNDDFGDRMKSYEKVYTESRVKYPDILCVRIDGKGFSKFTKGFKKPFDDVLSDAMIRTTEFLVKETHAHIGYTQSDEISLIYKPKEKSHEYIFGGKVSKINSVLASMATVSFNHYLALPKEYNDPVTSSAFFDCRSWSVPDLVEASNVLLWRVQDARKNSISALFRWTAGHRAMDGLDQIQMKEYLLEHHSIDWNDLPNKYKYGTYIKPVVFETYLTEEEIKRIPEHKTPDSKVPVKRTRIDQVDIGYFGDLTLEQRMEYINGT